MKNRLFSYFLGGAFALISSVSNAQCMPGFFTSSTGNDTLSLCHSDCFSLDGVGAVGLAPQGVGLMLMNTEPSTTVTNMDGIILMAQLENGTGAHHFDLCYSDQLIATLASYGLSIVSPTTLYLVPVALNLANEANPNFSPVCDFGANVNQFFVVTFNPPSTLSVAPSAVQCWNSAPFQLEGSPAGGTYFGTGVSQAGIFNPQFSGQGGFTVGYTLDVDSNGCSIAEDTVYTQVMVANFTSVSMTNSSCQLGELTLSINQVPISLTEGNDYFAFSGLTPANAVLSTDTLWGANGTVTVSGLVNGNQVHFTIEDEYGCVSTYNSASFQGIQTATINSVDPFCISTGGFNLIATPVGGTWSGQGVNAAGFFDPSLSGVGDFEIIYAVSGNPCFVSDTTIITVMSDQACITGGEIAIGASPVLFQCGGFLVDNGMTASDYTANQNDTTTVCPDPNLSLDQITNLHFNVFDLGFGDQLSVFNGPNTTYPMVGVYSGQDISGQDIYSTDPSGCLTVVFISDADASVGNVSAEISCGIPCSNPLVNITLNNPNTTLPALICAGETVTFDASGTQFFNGASYVSHVWIFDDGTVDSTAGSWPIVSHTFEEGGYMVELEVTDNNGCMNSIPPDIVIMAATTPNVTINTTEADNTICTGQPLNLQATFLPVTWTDQPTANLGGALFIPDDQSQCFSDTLTFSGFDAGATITTDTDLASFFINFEHSFMNDISISFTCPDGSMIMVHQNGGGGEFLGVPVDNDADLSPGTGFDYWWSPTATLGTWAAEAAANAGNTLASGTYSSVQPFANLIGCPLNGQWIVEICDGWGSDNGYIFDWAVNFAPYLYPDILTFTPEIGMNCDSSFWSGPNMIDNFNFCDTVQTVANAAGDYSYTYHLLDNHGCEYTHDLTVHIYAAPVVNAGPDVPYCGLPLNLQAVLTNPAPGQTYNYSWAQDTLVSNPNTAATTVPTLEDPSYFTVTVQSTQDVACRSTDSLLVNVIEQPVHIEHADTLCAEDPLTLSAQQLIAGATYSWYYSDAQFNHYPAGSVGPTLYLPSVFSQTYYCAINEPVCNYHDTSRFVVLTYPCDVTFPNIFTPNEVYIADDSYTIYDCPYMDENGTYHPEMNPSAAGNNSFFICGLLDSYGESRFPGSRLRMYNQWGALVYESDNYKNEWNPVDLSPGTYYYVFNLARVRPEEYSGYVYVAKTKNQ